MSNNNIIPIRGGQDDAPERPKDAYHKDGYVYVVEFSDGTVKVGKARSLRSRLGNHRHDAEKFALSISRWWGSPLHRGYGDSEKQLITHASTVGGIQGGREYFSGVDFSGVVEFASSLQMTPTSPQLAESEEKQSHEKAQGFVRSLFPNSKYPRIYIDNWPAAFALGAFFDPTENLPDLSGDIMPETEDGLAALAEGIAVEGGISASEVMEWSAYDWMCHLLDTSVRSAKVGMRIRIHEEGREDLYESWALRSESA